MLITPEEAMNVIIKLQDKMVKQRSFWDAKLYLMKKNYEDKIDFLENKLSSNKNIWNTMKNRESGRCLENKECFSFNCECSVKPV